MPTSSLPAGGHPIPSSAVGRAPCSAMATVGKISFTVRSLLDLPEPEGDGAKEQDSAESYGGSPYREWMETDRNHYLCEWGEWGASLGSGGEGLGKICKKETEAGGGRRDATTVVERRGERLVNAWLEE